LPGSDNTQPEHGDTGRPFEYRPAQAATGAGFRLRCSATPAFYLPARAPLGRRKRDPSCSCCTSSRRVFFGVRVRWWFLTWR
jgi:hypothetical protein